MAMLLHGIIEKLQLLEGKANNINFHCMIICIKTSYESWIINIKYYCLVIIFYSCPYFHLLVLNNLIFHRD